MFAEVIQLPLEPSNSEVGKCVRALKQGARIGIPSHEGYLVMANADNRESVDILAAHAMQLPDLTLPDLDAFSRAFPEPHSLVQHLANCLLPEPVTLRLPHPAFRYGLPVKVLRSPLARRIVLESDVPVLSVIARSKDGLPLRSPLMVANSIRYRPDIVVEHHLPGQPMPNPRVSLFRAGIALSARDGELRERIARLLELQIHFVCLGNINRSAYAHQRIAQINEQASRDAESIDSVFVPAYAPSSSGLIAIPGNPATELMCVAAEPSGCEPQMRAHKASRFPSAEAANADAIFPMTRSIASEIDRLDTPSKPLSKRVVTFPETGDIADPMGGEPKDYFDCAQRLDKWLETHFIVPEDLPFEEELSKR